MRRLIAIIRAFLASIRTVLERVWDGAQWTTRTVTRAVQSPPVQGAIDFIDSVADTPGRLLGSLSGGGGGTAPQPSASATAAAQTAANVAKTAEKQVQTDLSLKQTVNLFQCAARFRYLGHDWQQMAQHLPANLRTYLQALSLTECGSIYDADAETVRAFIAKESEEIPGVRTWEQLAADRGRVPDRRYTSQEDHILDAVGKRIRARRPPHMADDYGMLAE